jgi:hypothetical protein
MVWNKRASVEFCSRHPSDLEVISAKQFSEAAVTGLVFQTTRRSSLAELVTDIKRILAIYASFFKIIKVNSKYVSRKRIAYAS